jgi:glycosyltransferase involved in cell wall biosynthesis
MKRVVHMSSAHPANDVRIFVKQCRSLASAGYDVTLIARADANCFKNGIKIVAVKQSGGGRLGRMVLSTFNVLQKALCCRADLYHFHDPELMLAGGLLRLTGAKVVYDVHEDAPKQLLSKSWIPVSLRRPIAFALKALEWLMTRFVYTSVVAATPSIALRFPPGKTSSVQNFPIIDELTPPGPTVAMAQRPLRVVYAGGLTAIRGVCEMVTAMERVETPGSRLILAGLFAERDLEQKGRALAGWQRVDYLGLLDRPGIANLLGGARAGLVLFHNVPNHTSAYPNKLFEYMSAALPVIASHFPLWRSIVERDRCGLLVDPRDVAAIAKAIDWVLTHPEEAEAMGRRGREAVATTYNWPAEEKKLLEIYSNELD